MKNKYSLALPTKIHPAVIAVWAAVVAASNIIPTLQIIGTGSRFSFAAILSPLSGVLFGPLAGALCSAVGGFIGSLLAPHTAWMGLGTFIIGTATAFTTGCVAWGKWPLVTVNARGGFVISGGIIVYLIGTLLWFSQELGRSVPLFPLIYYGLGFVAYILGSLIAGKALTGKNMALKIPALWLCAFGGMIGGASIGNFFGLILLSLPAQAWTALIMISPMERAVFSLGAALVGVSLLVGLPKIGIFVGPQLEDYGTELEPPKEPDL